MNTNVMHIAVQEGCVDDAVPSLTSESSSWSMHITQLIIPIEEEQALAHRYSVIQSPRSRHNAQGHESSSGTSSTRAARLAGLELPESWISSMCAEETGDAPPLVSLAFSFSERFFLPFFLGTSHSHSGINDSTCKRAAD